MSVVSTAKAQKLAYKSMKNSYYVIGTMFLYAIIIVGSILLNDITNIFDFASAIAISCLAFLFPGSFYLMSLKQYNVEGRPKKCKCFAYFCLALGCFNFCLGSTSAILGIV